MNGSIRFMTAITPAYAHAYQFSCLADHIPVAHRQKFRLLVAKARYPHLSNVRTATLERGNDFQRWTINTDGGTRAAWTLVPTVIAESPAQAQIYHAARLQSRGKPWKRMRGSCRRIGCFSLSVET